MTECTGQTLDKHWPHSGNKHCCWYHTGIAGIMCFVMYADVPAHYDTFKCLKSKLN